MRQRKYEEKALIATYTSFTHSSLEREEAGAQVLIFVVF